MQVIANFSHAVRFSFVSSAAISQRSGKGLVKTITPATAPPQGEWAQTLGKEARHDMENATKTYSNKSVAFNVAKKLTKKDGQERRITELENGQFIIELISELAQDMPADEVGDLVEGSGVQTDGQPEEADVPGEVTVVLNPVEPVTLTILGAWESKSYVYTPKIAGKTRWFRSSDFSAIAPVDGGLQLTAIPKVFTKRGISVVAAVAPEASESAPEHEAPTEAEIEAADSEALHAALDEEEAAAAE